MRIRDEIRLLYKKKQQLNNTLYKIHLKAAQEWGNAWYIILDSIIDSTNNEIESNYRTIDNKLNELSKVQNQKNEFQKKKAIELVALNYVNYNINYCV